jgi:hypothetical protein
MNTGGMEVSEVFQSLCTGLGGVALTEPVTHGSLATIEETEEVLDLGRHLGGEDERGVLDILGIPECIFNYQFEFRIRIGSDITHEELHVSTRLEVIGDLVSFFHEFTGCYDESPRVTGGELEVT